MSDHKYKISSPFPKKDQSNTKNVIDLLYNVFSFKLVNSYFFKYLLVTTYDTIKKKLSFKNISKLQQTVLFNQFFFLSENIFWSINQSNYKENRKNLLFQKKVYSLEELEKLVEHIIISVYKSINSKISDKTIENIKNDVFERMSLETLIPSIEKDHLPPLASNTVYKTYRVKDKRKVIDDEKVTEYSLYRKNDVISKFPLTALSTGFEMKQLLEDNYVSVNLRYLLQDKHLKLLKKRYTGKKNDFNNAIYYLLTYYDLNEFLRENGDISETDVSITDKKISKLYSKAIELAGSPLTVPENKSYFSLFPDIEQYFGSLGSFYDVIPEKGIYSIHFKISSIFVENAIIKVEKWLSSAVKNEKSLTILLIFPFQLYFSKEFQANMSKTYLVKNIYEESMSKIEKSKYLKSSSKNSKNIIFTLSS